MNYWKKCKSVKFEFLICAELVELLTVIMCWWLISEEMFPRLGQMIVDFEPPVKKLSEEFIPHAKVSTLSVVVP